LRSFLIHWDPASLPLDLDRPLSIARRHDGLPLTGCTGAECGEIAGDGLVIESPFHESTRIHSEAKMPYPTGCLKIMRLSHPDHLMIP
jgi:hypothetical protein